MSHQRGSSGGFWANKLTYEPFWNIKNETFYENILVNICLFVLSSQLLC